MLLAAFADRAPVIMSALSNIAREAGPDERKTQVQFWSRSERLVNCGMRGFVAGAGKAWRRMKRGGESGAELVPTFGRAAAAARPGMRPN